MCWESRPTDRSQSAAHRLHRTGTRFDPVPLPPLPPSSGHRRSQRACQRTACSCRGRAPPPRAASVVPLVTTEAPNKVRAHSPHPNVPRSPSHLALILQRSCRAAVASLCMPVTHSISCTIGMPGRRLIRPNSHEPLVSPRAASVPRQASYHLAASCSPSALITLTHLVVMFVSQDGTSGVRLRYQQCPKVHGGPLRPSDAARRPHRVAASSVDHSLQYAAGCCRMACGRAPSQLNNCTSTCSRSSTKAIERRFRPMFTWPVRPSGCCGSGAARERRTRARLWSAPERCVNSTPLHVV